MTRGNSSHSQSAPGGTVSATVNGNGLFAARRQKNLFDSVETVAPGSLDDGALVRAVLIRSIRDCGKSRAQLADDISRLSGRKVTETSLNKFTAESRTDYRWPAELDRAFCAATGDLSLLICRVEAAGYRVIDATQAELLELGREYLQQKRATAQVEMLEKRLSGVDL